MAAMSPDRDGYGPRPHQSDVDRLLEDTRTLSESSIERIAQAWIRDAGAGWSDPTGEHREQPRGAHASWVEAERAALHALVRARRSSEWDELRNRLMDLTERHNSLVAWRAEHGDSGHRAEDALLAAGLALTARPELDPVHLRTLLGPMSEVLPWLSEVRPAGG
jgi:hypothetical protein